MSTISLRLPDSLHNKVRELVKHDHISINQFAATAIAEKLAALETEGYLQARAARGSRTRFGRALAKAPDVEPVDIDRLD